MSGPDVSTCLCPGVSDHSAYLAGHHFAQVDVPLCPIHQADALAAQTARAEADRLTEALASLDVQVTETTTEATPQAPGPSIGSPAALIATHLGMRPAD